MLVKQLSLFLENRSGRLAAATRVLAQNGVNILALSLADTSDFGVLRVIVDKPEAAQKTLRDAGFTVVASDVIAVEVEDQPGGLAAVLDILQRDAVNLEYMYAFSSLKAHRAALVFRFEDPDAAIRSLTNASVSVMSKTDLLGE